MGDCERWHFFFFFFFHFFKMVGIIDLMQFTPTAAAAGGKLAKHPLQDDANVNKYKQAATIVNGKHHSSLRIFIPCQSLGGF